MEVFVEGPPRPFPSPLTHIAGPKVQQCLRVLGQHSTVPEHRTGRQPHSLSGEELWGQDPHSESQELHSQGLQVLFTRTQQPLGSL